MLKGGDAAYSAAGTVTAAATEAPLVVLGPIDVPADSTRAVIVFITTGNTGVGTTSMSPRIRRGVDQTGTLINASSSVTAAASALIGLSMSAMDVLTLQGTVSYAGCVAAAGGSYTNVNASLFVLFV